MDSDISNKMLSLTCRLDDIQMNNTIDHEQLPCKCIHPTLDELGDLVRCDSLADAAKRNHDECARQALDDLNIVNDHYLLMKNHEVLFIATEHESFETLKLLLEKGFNPSTKAKHRNRAGTTPLHVACKNLSVKIMKLLLEHKADVNSIDEAKKSCLHYLIINGNYTDSLMIDKDPKLKKKGMAGIKILLEHNANVNLADHTGMTPLHLAAMQSNHKYVEVLIERY